MKIKINAVYGPYIVILGTFLNIVSIIFILISKNHKEPFLFFLPIPYIYWFIFLLLPVERPDQNEYFKDKLSRLIHLILSIILFMAALLSSLTNFALLFVLAMKGLLH